MQSSVAPPASVTRWLLGIPSGMTSGTRLSPAPPFLPSPSQAGWGIQVEPRSPTVSVCPAAPASSLCPCHGPRDGEVACSTLSHPLSATLGGSGPTGDAENPGFSRPGHRGRRAGCSPLSRSPEGPASRRPGKPCAGQSWVLLHKRAALQDGSVGSAVRRTPARPPPPGSRSRGSPEPLSSRQDTAHPLLPQRSRGSTDTGGSDAQRCAWCGCVLRGYACGCESCPLFI